MLALEIAVDSLAVARIGLGGDVLGLIRVDRPRRHLAPQQIVIDLMRLSKRLLRSRRASVLGIGVAVVGLVRRSDGFISVAPNLGWRDVPFGELLAAANADELSVAVANEADLGALAELRRGAARGAQDVLFISGEVGVGGGLIVGGRTLTGAAGYAGEVGHMVVNPDGSLCGCGSTGCWETEIGEHALLTQAGHRRDGGREAVEAVMREATAGSPKALAAMTTVGRWVGVGLAGLVNVFNPELVVLGGLLGRIQPFVAGAIQQELDHRVLSAPGAMVRVLPTALGVDAPLLGAAELAFEPMLSDPARWLPQRQPTSAIAS